MAKKRIANQGTVFRRRDGRWEGRLNLGFVGGKRRRKSFYADTQAEVSAKLVAAVRALQLGQKPAPGILTVKDFFANWLQEIAKPIIRPATYKGYEVALRTHVLPQLGAVKLVNLGPDDLDERYTKLLKEGLSATYIRLIHAVIHRGLSHAERRSLVGRNVASLVTPPRVSRKEVVALTPEQASRFLAATEDDRLHSLYVVAIHTGLRLGELCGLRWRDCSQDFISVRQQVSRIYGEWHFSEPKTKAGRRNITLSAAASEALRQHRLRQTEERLAAKDWEDHDLVFPDTRGGPLERTNLMRRSFKPALKRAGLPAIRFHDLRHTAATLLLAGGIHAKVVQEMLGHSSVAITLDIYSHTTPNLQAEAAAKMDDLLPAAANS